MDEVNAIAEGVWGRILRMKILYFLIGCAWLHIILSSQYEALMLKEQKMLMADMSFFLAGLGAVLSVLTLTFDLSKDLRQGTAIAYLSKSVSRTQYIFGKFLGTVWVGVVVTVLIAIGFFMIHNATYGSLPVVMVKAHLLIIISVLPMAAIALFFSTILSEAAAAVLTVATIWMAYSANAISSVSMLYGGIVPDLSLFNMRMEAVHGTQFGWSYIGLAFIWSVVYSVGLVSLSGIFFNKRDLG